MNKSLIQRIEPPGGEPRFVFLETIREYGLERLASSGEEAATRKAHAAYCVVLAEDEASERAKGIGGPSGGPQGDNLGWLDRLELEHDNFRAALDWLIETGQADWGLRLGVALFQFWEEREYLAQGRERLGDLLDLPGAAPRSRLRARAFFAAGVLTGVPTEARDVSAGSAGDQPRARRPEGDRCRLERPRGRRAEKGDLARSRSLLEESLGLWKDLGDPVALVRGLSNLANVARLEGHFDEARSLFEECLSISRELGDRGGMAWALDSEGDVAREQGDIESARFALRAESRDVPRAPRPVGHRELTRGPGQPGARSG